MEQTLVGQDIADPIPREDEYNCSDIEAFRNCLSPCLLSQKVQSLPFLKPLSHLSGVVILGFSGWQLKHSSSLSKETNISHRDLLLFLYRH